MVLVIVNPILHVPFFLFFVIRQGYGAEKHPLVIKYAKDTFKENLSLPNSSFPWDLGRVISCLHNTWIEILDISATTATLLPILRWAWAGEVITAMDIRNIKLEENGVIRVRDILKSTRKWYHIGTNKRHHIVTLQTKLYAQNIC